MRLCVCVCVSAFCVMIFLFLTVLIFLVCAIVGGFEFLCSIVDVCFLFCRLSVG